MKKVVVPFLVLMNFSLFSAPIKVPNENCPEKERYKDHPGDYPFPTEMTFNFICDHKINWVSDYFDPDSVKEGDTIFLVDWLLNWFTKEIHPKISNSYILVSNDTDSGHPMPGDRVILYDPKLAAWFCKNFNLSGHPKLFQIPIGQNIMQWYGFESYRDYLKNLTLQNDIHKNHLIYLNLSTRNHSEREVVRKLFSDSRYVFTRDSFVDRKQYWEEMASSKFTFAPRGIGVDTVRFWEAIVLGSIPVTTHSVLDDLYSGTPAVFVDKWEDVNEEFLNQKYAEIQTKIVNGELTNKKGFFDYWHDKIIDVQQQVRNRTWRNSKLETTMFDQGSLDILKNILAKASPSGKFELVMFGELLGLKPYQIAQNDSNCQHIYLYDCLGFDPELVPLSYKTRLLVSKNASRLNFVSEDDIPLRNRRLKKKNDSIHVFMDLSYYRIDLKKNLEILYKNSFSKGLICGNKAQDDYVRNHLEKFSIEHQLEISFLNDFWYFIKNK